MYLGLYIYINKCWQAHTQTYNECPKKTHTSYRIQSRMLADQLAIPAYTLAHNRARDSGTEYGLMVSFFLVIVV